MAESQFHDSSAWRWQWSRFDSGTKSDRLLFESWIHPVTLEEFRGQDVLECGCGGGQHTRIVAKLARSVVAVDLFTSDIADGRKGDLANADFVSADITKMDLGKQFDVVFCIGVIHHSSDPDAAFRSIYRHCKPGGKIIIWTYSAEGNSLARFVLEPVRKAFLSHMSKAGLLALSRVITATLYPIVFSLYRVKQLSFIPYYEYFGNFRKLSFERNALNVFDKLNAPRTHFIPLRNCREWLREDRFVPESITIRPHLGVSYTLVGVKREE